MTARAVSAPEVRVPPLADPADGCLGAVADALAQPVFVKDREHRFVYVNAAFAATTGLAPEALVGRTDFDVFPAAEAERIRSREEAAIAAGVAVEVREELLTDRAGRTRVIDALVVPLQAPAGEVTHLVGIIHDITHLKERERALSRGKEELEALVSARTEELRQAQQELLKKERLSVVGQLAAGLAHQVRNPLASITNAASVIERRLEAGMTEDAALALSIIKEEVLTANRIISDLLEYARVRPARPMHVALAELVESAFDPQALPPGVTLVREVPEDLTLLVDGDQLRTALRNVVRNALEAMSQGGTLTIAAERREGIVQIRVRDTGEGVPVALRAQMFDPLVSSKPFGLGLGLPTAKALIENQGGSLRCTSAAAGGTELVMELPVAPPTGDDAGRP